MANYRKSFNLRNGVQVDDDNFIVNANGLVGIGTSVPTEFLDIRGNAKVVGLVTANSLYAGIATVGILSATEGVSVTGVVTATSFSGSASGLTDIYAIAVDGWYISGGNISTTSNVGVGTTNPNGAFQVGTGVTISSNGNATYTGVITASSFNGSLNASNLTGTIDNARLPSNINVSGIVTATLGFVGNLTGTASTANSITNTANITVNSINSGFSTTGVSTVFATSHVGTGGTAVTALDSGRLGIGTALPTSELQIRKSSSSLAEVVSDSGQARISLGNSVGAGNSSAVLRFGNSAGVLDIINNDVGDVTTIIHNGTGAGSTGNFKWIYGKTGAERMTLTYDGKLGINQSIPINTLHVVGTSTVTGNAWFGGNLTVAGSISGNITYPSVISGTNLNNTSGVTTLSRLDVNTNVDFLGASFVGLGYTVGIGTDSGSNSHGLKVDNGIIANSIEITGANRGLEVLSGFITATTVCATGGFRSGATDANAIQIDYASSPDRIIFNVVGIGSTSLRLF